MLQVGYNTSNPKGSNHYAQTYPVACKKQHLKQGSSSDIAVMVTRNVVIECPVKIKPALG